MAVFSLGSFVPAAWARLGGSNAGIKGSVSWNYTKYDQSNDSGSDIDAYHFTQNYSLMYENAGLLGGGRLGSYDVGLGAEGGAFDSEINEASFSDSAFKFLYKGYLTLAPGGLPFRLDAYSYDLRPIAYQNSWRLSEAGWPLIFPDIVTELRDGQTIMSGVRFMAGIRNGSYLGKYREVLSQWPRLLVDYRDVYHRDTHALHKEEYTDRDLAFVSLNKKDNWFHYRLYEHKDYIRPQENENRKSVILGTIDHTLKRQWINMTNWIRISVEGTYDESSNGWDNYDEETYTLNAFALFNRPTLDAGSFLSMQRQKYGDSWLSNELSLPVYVNKAFSPETSARSLMQVYREKTDNFKWDIREKLDVYHARAQLDTNKRQRVQYSPGLEVETVDGTQGDGQAVRGSLEVRSNRLLRRQPISWYGSGSLALFDGTARNGLETSLWETELIGGVNYNRGRMTYGGSQELIFANGSYTSGTTHFMGSRIASVGDTPYSPLNSNLEDSTYLRSLTTLYLEHVSNSRITNRFELRYRYQDIDNSDRSTLVLEHRLLYGNRWWNVDMQNRFVSGDNDSFEFSTPKNDLLGYVIDIAAHDEFSSRTHVSYQPNRYWKNKFTAGFYWGIDDDSETNVFFHLKQEAERSFFSQSSVRRKKGTLYEAVTFEQFMDGVDKQAAKFNLGGSYYLTAAWRIGMDASYYYYDFISDYLEFSLFTDLDFPLFKVRFNYDYAMLDDANTVAHRYELNVQKTF